MGRERRKVGQHLYLCLAALLSACLCACLVTGTGGEDRWILGRWQHLGPVLSRLEKDDFEGAINQYQNMLTRPGGTAYPDLVLFDLGLLYVHYDNPRKDFKKSLACFSRVIKDYPGSSLAEEARIWASLVEALEKAKRVDIELEEKQRQLNSEERDERAKPAGR